MHRDFERISELSGFRTIAAIAGLMAAAVLGTNGWAYVTAPLPVAGVSLFAVVTSALTLALIFVGYWSVRGRMRDLSSALRDEVLSANTDALTGALNRAYFFGKLKAAIKKADRDPVGYIQLDMDHLKQLNDGNGHSVGDMALAHLVECIHQTIPNAVVGRLGGDEFGVMVPGCGSAGALKKLCAQMRERLARPYEIEGRPYSLSATMGIATAPQNAQTIDELMSKADLALYAGKRSGRNTAIVFEGDMLSEERWKRAIQRELRAAILMDELEVYYQPIFDANTCELRSYEALVRWMHPLRGVIPPNQFISIAEETDIIDKLGDWVLRRACAEFADLDTPRISINVSAVQLRRPDFADRFEAIVEESGVSFSCLTIEVTETVPLNNGGVELTNLERLRDLGASIAIDDFGAGNASLAYLKLFGFGTLKIDRAYVQSITTSKFDAILIGSICRLAKVTHMDVVAEGVETVEQVKVLRELGVTALQGFYLGRPEPLRMRKGVEPAMCPLPKCA